MISSATGSQWDVIVVGAGPAGLIAAERAAARGRRTLLIDKNRRAGAKILISGGGRCNLAPACDARGVVAAFGAQGSFLHSALAALSPAALIDLFHAEGVPTYTDGEQKIFPRSDRAEDVVAALARRLERGTAQLSLGESLTAITSAENGYHLATTAGRRTASSVVLCTGGKSYPGCGTTGDGYGWAEALGHRVVPLRAALVPLRCELAWLRELQGIALTDVHVAIAGPATQGLRRGDRSRLQARGALLFTHFGLSGPTAMNVSRFVSNGDSPAENEATATSAGGGRAAFSLGCDFLPAMPRAAVEQQIQDTAAAQGRREAASLLERWLPQRLAAALIAARLPDGLGRAAELSRAQRSALVEILKATEFPIAGTLGFSKAEVTAGGVDLAEVDSRSMESKRRPGLYFAGELLDLDGPIGGFNLQAAFSTGWLAGMHA